MGCCQSCSGFAIQTVLSLLSHFYTWLKRQMKSFKIAFWRLSRVCGSVCGGVDIRSTRKESHRDSRIRSEMHSAKGNGTSLQSSTANCRLQREQHFKTNSILGMPLPTQERPTHPSHPYHYQRLKGHHDHCSCRHSQTRLCNMPLHMPLHRAFYCKTIMAELSLSILPVCLLQRQRRLITKELELSKLLFTIQ